jgi:glutamate carboxypeptidase
MRNATRNLTTLVAIGCAVLGLGGAAGAAGLGATERKAAAVIDRGVPGWLKVLEETVNANTGTMNFVGIRDVGEFFGTHFERLGFSVRWVDGEPFKRAGHLIAERRGRSGAPKVLLIGHLDTVFEPDSPFQRFQRLDDSTARGPGIVDMKGGIVVMLMALEALAETRMLDRLSVTVVLTGDEEKPGQPLALARHDLIAAAEAADVAIGFEDGDGDPRTAVVARRGATRWLLRTRGTPAHSSQIFRDDVGDGAVLEAARILSAFRDSLHGEAYLTFNPAVIVGGTRASFDPEQGRGTASGKTNVVAESTVVAGDLRTLTPQQLDRARATMISIVARHHPHSSAEILLEEGYPPLPPSEGNRRLLAMFDQASRDLGFGPVGEDDPARAGAADVSFTAGLVEMAIDGVGLMGGGGHTVEETADLRTLPIQAKRTAVTLLRLMAWKPKRP